MSFLGFCIRAVAVTPQVMLRFLPVLFVYLLLFVGLFLATENIWVIYMVAFLLGTIGYAFLIVQGLRAALQAIRATTAPTYEGTVTATIRMTFIYGLIQLLLLFMFGTIVYLIFDAYVFPGMDPQALEALEVVLRGEDEEMEEGAYLAMMSLLFERGGIGLTLYIFCSMMALGFGMALFGVPMAGLAANAVQYSPGNDPIFGIARYMPQQLVLYALFVALPSAVFAAVPVQIATSGASGGMLWAMLGGYGLYQLFALCLPWSAMAIAYSLVRERLAYERKAESVPIIDYEAERESLRDLRRNRTSGATGGKVYDPRAASRAARGLSPEDD